MPLSIIHFTIDSWLPLRKQISTAQWSYSIQEDLGFNPCYIRIVVSAYGFDGRIS